MCALDGPSLVGTLRLPSKNQPLSLFQPYPNSDAHDICRLLTFSPIVRDEILLHLRVSSIQSSNRFRREVRKLNTVLFTVFDIS